MIITAIIPAAGTSTRFAPGTEKDKLTQEIDGRPVFMRALEKLSNRPEVTRTILAVNPDSFDMFKLRYGDALGLRGVVCVPGGKIDRWETIKNALAHVPDDSTHVAIHDGARPCVSDYLITRLFDAAKLFDAVIPGIAVSATLKRVGKEEESAVEDDQLASAILGDAPAIPGTSINKARRVIETVDRTDLLAIQTPQIFETNLLKRSYAQDDLTSTDDASLIERLGEPVRVIEGDTLNLKITTEADLKLARLIINTIH